MVVRNLCRSRGVVLDLLLRSPSHGECAVWDPVLLPLFGRRILSGSTPAGNPWRGLVCRSLRGVTCTSSSARGDVRSRVGFVARFRRMDELWKGGAGRKSFSKLESGEGPYEIAGAGGGGAGGARNNGGDGGGGPGDGALPSRSSSGWRALLAWYMSKLEEHPVQTKALTAGFLNLCGDLISQLLVEKSDHYDLKRSAIFFLIGLALVGPTLHYWYLTLSRMITISGPAGAGLRLVLDQLAFAPVFIAAFFSALLILEGRPSDIGPKLKQDWASVLVTNWKIWVPFQFFNFLLVPQPLQVGASNVVALAWNVYLSHSSHKEVQVQPT